MGGFIRPSAKIKELEHQIDEMKQSHARKTKLMRDKHMNQIRKEQQDKVVGSGTVIVSNPNNYNKQIIELQNDLDDKMNEIGTLNDKMQQKMSMINNLQMTIDAKDQSQVDLKTQISLLQIQLTNAVKQQSNGDFKQPAIVKEIIKEVTVERQSDKDLNSEFVEKEKIYKERLKMMESEVNEYKRECEIMSERVDLERSKGEQSVKAMQNELQWNQLEKEKTQQVIATH